MAVERAVGRAVGRAGGRAGEILTLTIDGDDDNVVLHREHGGVVVRARTLDEGAAVYEEEHG